MTNSPVLARATPACHRGIDDSGAGTLQGCALLAHRLRSDGRHDQPQLPLQGAGDPIGDNFGGPFDDACQLIRRRDHDDHDVCGAGASANLVTVSTPLGLGGGDDRMPRRRLR